MSAVFMVTKFWKMLSNQWIGYKAKHFEDFIEPASSKADPDPVLISEQHL